MRREFEQAAKAVEKAVALAPNYADGWGLLALVNNMLGRGDQALRFVHRGMELNPGYTWDYLFNEGLAYYNLGEYDRAVVPLRDALERNENAFMARLYLAASYVRLDRIEDAEWEVTQAEVSNPELSLAHLKLIHDLTEGDHRRRFFDDMRAAGLSE